MVSLRTRSSHSPERRGSRPGRTWQSSDSNRTTDDGRRQFQTVVRRPQWAFHPTCVTSPPPPAFASHFTRAAHEEVPMPAITTKDGAQIFYKDWGSGQPVVFSHGWPLNADSWDDQLLLFASNGFRAIAHDRRGHGRSTQTWSGNDMDTYA